MTSQDDVVLVHLEYIKAGIDELKDGQRAQNGQLAQHAQAIAVLQDRVNDGRSSGARWGAGVGAAASALVAGLWHLFGDSK